MALICLSLLPQAGSAAHQMDRAILENLPSPPPAKLPVRLAQLLDAPDDEAGAPAMENTSSEETSSSAAASDSNSFVFAGDLARYLRQIDPDAKVDWDGKKLRIEANGEEFAIFPTGKEMVINGDVEAGTPPLKIRNNEIYVPQAVVARIGRELEAKSLTEAAETTSTLTAEPTATPQPTETPKISILPDMTPVESTPPAGETPESTEVLPEQTPAPAPTPTTTPTPTPAPTAAPEATPFPQATATPTPKPTPTPTPTPTPAPNADQVEAKKRNAMLSTASFKASLRDKVSVSTHNIAVYSSSQLEKMAAVRSVKKVLIHPDQSGIEREDQYGKEAARLSLAIAQKLKTELEAAGFEAVLTHKTEDSVTIGQSLETVSKSGAQVFLVVAVGYSTSFQDLGGYRVFYMNESVDYNTLRDRTFDASEMVPTDLNYRPFENGSKILASSVKNSVKAALDRDPVGMNPAPNYLTRRAPMASAVVEVGYLSNPADAKRLTDSAEQDSMVKALSEGIENFASQVSEGKTLEVQQ